MQFCSSSAVITPSDTRPSYLVARRRWPSSAFCIRWRIAVASVLQSCVAPSTSSSPNGWSLLLLITCSTPCRVSAVQDRHHHHLLGAVAGTLVHLLEEAQGGVDALERLVVVDVGDVHQLLAVGRVAGDALRADRQLQVLAGVQARLDLGDDGGAVLVDGIEREPVGVEQLADVLARLEHDLVDVLGLVDLRRDQLQLAVEQRLERDAALLRRQHLRIEECLRVPVFRLEHRVHAASPLIDRTPVPRAASGCRA